jgi:TonB family protein
VINAAPAPPETREEKITVPPGERKGGFAASPDGELVARAGDLSGEAPASLENGAAVELRLPDISVSGGKAPEQPSAMARPSNDGDLKQLMARASRTDYLRPDYSREVVKERSVESEFFGTRRFYTVHMNMPNLSSGAGSWVLRFAELEERHNLRGDAEPLTTPEAIRKVDPMYVAAAMREKIQGTVTLAALVLKDGTVANIRIVSSLDPRLDASAVSAMTQWKFQPARRGDTPIDLEVLVQIPFRLSSF